MAFKVPEKLRVKHGPMASDSSLGNNGAFIVKSLKFRFPLSVIASDGYGWEHVSVSTPIHAPSWDEMCAVKSLFWDDEDCVVQFHPPKSEYVNQHPFCLHLWRKVGAEFETPPSILVGYKEVA